MQALLFYSILSAALFYLASRAMVTQWLWSRYPPNIARWADCAACSGFWYGVVLSCVFGNAWGSVFTNDIAAIDTAPRVMLEAGLTGLITMITTPLVAAIHDQSIQALGSTVEPESISRPDSSGSPSE